MALGLWGKKIGNTQVFDAGAVHHVVIVRVAPMDVIGLRQEGKHTLMQVAYGDNVRANKAMSGHFKSAGVKPRRHIVEFSIDESLAKRHPVGSQISAQALEGVTSVDVLGVTKGHGFTGPVKRHGFSMQPATHGNSLSHRAHGSTGQCQDPGRVFKGKKMAGQHGAIRRTIQNLSVHKVDVNEDLVWIQGAIPGPVGGYVLITPSFKKHQCLAAPIEAISDDEVSKGTKIDASQPVADEKAKEDTEAAAPQPAADEKVKEDTEAAAPQPAADEKVKEDTEAAAPQPAADEKVKEDTEAAAPQPAADEKAKKDTEAAAPQPAADEKAKEDTEAAAPQPAADEKAKEDTEAAAPQPTTDTEVKEDREASDGN